MKNFTGCWIDCKKFTLNKMQPLSKLGRRTLGYKISNNPVDRPIVEKAASLKAGRGIPYIDSIILATYMLAGCSEIHTTDKSHFAEIKNNGLSFVFY